MLQPFSHLKSALALCSICLLAGGCASSSSSDKQTTERAPLTESTEAPTEQRADSATDEELVDQSTPVERKDETTSGAQPSSDLPVVAVGPVAEVDGTTIPAETFNELIERRTKDRREVPYRVAVMYKERTLRQVVDDYLITERIDEAGVEVSEAEVEKQFAEFKERFPDEEAFQAFLERSGVTVARIKSDMTKSARLKKHLEDEHDVAVTEEDAREHYKKNAKSFEKPERVKASHILIKVEGENEEQDEEARKKARELADRARRGADFSELAEAHSEGPSARRGGDLGFFPKGRMVQKFDEVVFEMKKGDISEPVRTRFGYHVIKLTDKKEAGKESFEDARADIVKRLERQKLRTAMDAFIGELRAEAKIVEKPENIEVRVEEPPEGQDDSRGISPEVLEKIKQKQQQDQAEE
ncbi:MAG: peptidylprolyl isomerase [Myxococcota bacterium]